MNQGQVPDLYKLPPMEFQSFDDWNKNATTVDEDDDDDDNDNDDDVPGFSFLMEPQPEPAPDPEPEPDYSDSESSNDSDDAEPTNIWQLQKEHMKDNLHVLSKEQYEQIISAAEANLGIDIPAPDYHDDGDGVGDGNSPLRSPKDLQHFMPAEGTEGELIVPKKLVNPNLESREKRDLIREMKMNYRLGVDVLQQKSELTKKLEQRRDNVQKKKQEEYLRSKRSSLEVRLEAQANKLKLTEKDNVEKEKPLTEEKETEEFLKVYSKINRQRVDSS